MFITIIEIHACAISSDVLIILALLFKCVTTALIAIVMPHLKSIAFIPAATDLQPSVNIARVRMVAHVVPAQKKIIVNKHNLIHRTSSLKNINQLSYQSQMITFP